MYPECAHDGRCPFRAMPARSGEAARVGHVPTMRDARERSALPSGSGDVWKSLAYGRPTARVASAGAAEEKGRLLGQNVPSADFARNPSRLNAEAAERVLSGKQGVPEQWHPAGAAPPAGAARKKRPARCPRRRTRQCSLAAILTCVFEAGMPWGPHAQKVHTVSWAIAAAGRGGPRWMRAALARLCQSMEMVT